MLVGRCRQPLIAAFKATYSRSLFKCSTVHVVRVHKWQRWAQAARGPASRGVCCSAAVQEAAPSSAAQVGAGQGESRAQAVLPLLPALPCGLA